MIKKSSIFQPSADASAFLIALSALMTFLMVLSLGTALSLSNAVDRYSRSWDLKATLQVLPGGDVDAAKKILRENSEQIKSVYQLSDGDLSRMLKPWMSETRDISNFLPAQIDITFNSPQDIRKIGDQVNKLKSVKFISHSDAISKLMVFGGAVQVLASVIILFVGLASILAIIFATNGLIKSHSREVGILSAVGAYDSFATNQISMILLRLTAIGCAVGVVLGVFGIWGILGVADAQKTGIISQMSLTSGDVIRIGIVPVILSGAAFMISRAVVLKTLRKGAFK